MWKKMTRQGGGVDSVYDAVALRAVIKAKRLPAESDDALEERSKQLCYHVSCFSSPLCSLPRNRSAPLARCSSGQPAPAL